MGFLQFLREDGNMYSQVAQKTTCCNLKMDNPIGRFRMPGLCGWLHTLLRTMFQKISCPYRSVHDVLQVANIICCYLVPHDTSWLATLVPKNPFAFSKPYVETAPTRCRRTALRLRPKVVLQRQRGRAVPEASRRGGAKNHGDLAWITWMLGCLYSDWWRTTDIDTVTRRYPG